MDNKKWLEGFYPGEIQKFVNTLDRNMCDNCPLDGEANCEDCPIKKLMDDAWEVFKSKDLRGWVN